MLQSANPEQNLAESRWGDYQFLAAGLPFQRGVFGLQDMHLDLFRILPHLCWVGLDKVLRHSPVEAAGAAKHLGNHPRMLRSRQEYIATKHEVTILPGPQATE